MAPHRGGPASCAATSSSTATRDAGCNPDEVGSGVESPAGRPVGGRAGTAETAGREVGRPHAHAHARHPARKQSRGSRRRSLHASASPCRSSLEETEGLSLPSRSPPWCAAHTARRAAPRRARRQRSGAISPPLEVPAAPGSRGDPTSRTLLAARALAARLGRCRPAKAEHRPRARRGARHGMQHVIVGGTNAISRHGTRSRHRLTPVFQLECKLYFFPGDRLPIGHRSLAQNRDIAGKIALVGGSNP